MQLNRRQLIKASAVVTTGWGISSVIHAEAASPGRWQRLADLPFPVQEIYPTIANNRIHVAGGFAVMPEGGREITAMHWQYSIANNQWRQLTAMPEERHHPNLVACNGAIYALGGFKAEAEGSWVMQDQTWQYHPAEDRWEVLAPAPEVHGETVCLSQGNYIHLIGGRRPKAEANASWADHSDVDRHFVFDTQSKTWHKAAPALTARNSAAGAVIDKQLYVAGGRTVGGGNLANLEVYNAVEDRWRTAAPMPQAQGGLGAAALNNQLLVFGGEFFGAGGRGVYEEAWRYDIFSDQWEAIAPMLTPRHGLGGVSDGRRVYAIAGATRAGGNGTSAVMEALTI